MPIVSQLTFIDLPTSRNPAGSTETNTSALTNMSLWWSSFRSESGEGFYRSNKETIGKRYSHWRTLDWRDVVGFFQMDSSNHLQEFLNKFPLYDRRQEMMPIKLLLCASASGHEAEETLVTLMVMKNVRAFSFDFVLLARYPLVDESSSQSISRLLGSRWWETCHAGSRWWSSSIASTTASTTTTQPSRSVEFHFKHIATGA